MLINSQQSMLRPEIVNQQISELTKRVNELEKFKMNIDYERQIENAKQLTTKLQANAVSYTNLVIIAGYAGLFTFWTSIKADLPEWLYAVCGLMLAASLLIFVGWEVIKMIWGAVYLNKVQKLLVSKPIGPQNLLDFQKSLSDFEIRSNRIWPYFLCPSIFFGVGAGILLLGFFIYRLWQIV